MRFRASTVIGVPVEVAFDYLADPANRPGWQPSLRGVELIDSGEPRIGMRWRDVLPLGIRPTLSITALRRPNVWAEKGYWRSMLVVLTMTMTPEAGGTRIDVTVEAHARGLLRLGLAVLKLIGPYVARSDLHRAGRRLAARDPGAQG